MVPLFKIQQHCGSKGMYGLNGAMIDCDTELPVPIDDLRIAPNYPELIAQMEKCEFKSLLQEVRDEAAKAGPAVQAELKL